MKPKKLGSQAYASSRIRQWLRLGHRGTITMICRDLDIRYLCAYMALRRLEQANAAVSIGEQWRIDSRGHRHRQIIWVAGPALYQDSALSYALRMRSPLEAAWATSPRRYTHENGPDHHPELDECGCAAVA